MIVHFISPSAIAVLKREIRPRARHQFFDEVSNFSRQFSTSKCNFTLEQNKKLNLWTKKLQKQGHSKY